MQAVILAAGMGTRISEYFDKPKGLIPIADQPIIVSSINKLKDAGISEIAIIAGHKSHHYETLAKNDHAVTVIINPHYAQYSSLYSLYCAKKWVTRDLLILESDIFYEARALSRLIHHPKKDAILVSGKTNSGDEVYVQTAGSKLVEMNKDITKLSAANIYGEFVGINKLSKSGFNQLITLSENNNALLCDGYYEEDGLIALSKEMTIDCLKIPDLLWREIDNIDQLAQAKHIYDQMLSKKETLNDI